MLTYFFIKKVEIERCKISKITILKTCEKVGFFRTLPPEHFWQEKANPPKKKPAFGASKNTLAEHFGGTAGFFK